MDEKQSLDTVLTAKNRGFGAFQEQINIELFNDIIAFVMTTTAADTLQVHKNLTDNHIWYSRSVNDNIQAQYGFRYFGELLERFEDKVGSNIMDIRAIALAMAYTKELFTDDMFVGNQKNNFIRKITRISADDIYLKGALHLLKKGETDAGRLLDELMKTKYTQTEELIFVISLYDDFEQGFLSFKPQLINLLGTARSIRVARNMNIYCWLIKQLCNCTKIKEMRSKDLALFRALMELPTSFIKVGIRYHNVLLASGYTTEEIIFLNSYILRFRPTASTIDLDSIVAEKIAVEMCKTFINSENTLAPEVYEHLEWLLEKYNNFHIKINGYKGIYQAIQNDVNIINPQTFLWLFKIERPRDVHIRFRFDILDGKWDILSNELNADVYRKLFDKQLTANSELTGAKVREHIQKYDTLTGASYLAQFEQKYSYDRNDVFALLVKDGIIDLADAFTSCPSIDFVKDDDKNESRPPILQYISRYISGVHSREAFDFYKYFLNKYNFIDMHRLFIGGPDFNGYRNIDYFFMDKLYKGPPRYYGDNEKERFKIKRSFLSDDEHRELFSWLDDYILQFKADKYIEFTALMLLDSFVTTLFPQNELRRIYDMVHDMDIDVVKQNNSKLKHIYLSETELQAELDADETRKQEQKKKAHEKQIQDLRDELAAGYNGTFKSLIKYMDKYRFNNCDDAKYIAAEYLEVTLIEKNYILDKKEFGRFLQFSGKLLKEGYIQFDSLQKHISTIKEVAEHVENS